MSLAKITFPRFPQQFRYLQSRKAVYFMAHKKYKTTEIQPNTFIILRDETFRHQTPNFIAQVFHSNLRSYDWFRLNSFTDVDRCFARFKDDNNLW
jgi:hypothetical protein